MADSQDTYTDYLSFRELQMSNIRSVPAKDTIENNRHIYESWDLFDAGEITAIQLVWRVKYKTGAGTPY